MKHLFSRLRSYLVFCPLVFLYTGVLGAVSLACAPFDRSGRAQHAIARLWARMIMATLLAPVKVEGLERIDTSKAHLYAFNHLSSVDIPVIYSELPFAFRIMAKRELFRYPFMGWHLKVSGQIPIESESALASMRSMKLAVETLRQGMPLVVFPEGGRTVDGHIQPFMRGAFYAAIKAQVEIVPGALVGAYEMLKMNTFHVRPRPLQMIVGAPISTVGYTTRDMDKLAAQTRAAIEEMYYSHHAELEKPAGAAVPVPAGGQKLESGS